MDRYQEALKKYHGGTLIDVLKLAMPQLQAAKEPNTVGVFGGRPFTAYHGSPHEFEKFDSSKIGTGGSAQSFVHGLYFAENPEVAKHYQTSVAGRLDQDEFVANRYLKNSADRQNAIDRIQDSIDRMKVAVGEGWKPTIETHSRAKQLLQQGWEPPKGNLYQVSIDEGAALPEGAAGEPITRVQWHTSRPRTAAPRSPKQQAWASMRPRV